MEGSLIKMTSQNTYNGNNVLDGCLDDVLGCGTMAFGLGVTAALLISPFYCMRSLSDDIQETEPTPVVQQYHGIPTQHYADSVDFIMEKYEFLEMTVEFVEE